MHLQQTERGSIATGGAQYYFHDLSDPVLTYLRKQGSVRVALVTPYGATKSDFFAVGKDHKLVSSDGTVTTGRSAMIAFNRARLLPASVKLYVIGIV